MQTERISSRIGIALLTPAEMGRADRMAMDLGPHDGFALMLNAGRAVARQVLSRFGSSPRVHVLCGPGNNGGDGYVAAVELRRAGMETAVHALGSPAPASDAARALHAFGEKPLPLDDFTPGQADVVVDALFGAGIARPLAGDALTAVSRAREAGCPVVAVDLPSGISGESGSVLGDAFDATVTVTFFRKKPGHLLFPGRRHCGEVVVADIGISDSVLDEIAPGCFENLPPLWRELVPALDPAAHKYSRGAVGVFSGGPHATGAARLAAMAAQRAGAGAVTVLSPAAAMQVNASHLTSIMLARVDSVEDVAAMLGDGRSRAYVLGPGFGVGERLRAFALALLGADHDGVVLDADAVTAFAEVPEALFARDRQRRPALVLTPHEGEFRRLFPRLAEDAELSRLDRARRAATLADAVVVYKGPDTVVAAPDGRAAINTNATAALATAGSGDVLAGIVGALLSRKMPAFEAACAAVWLHGEAGRLAGTHAIAEDLVVRLPEAFALGE